MNVDYYLDAENFICDSYGNRLTNSYGDFV